LAPQLGWLLIIIVVGFAVVWPVAQLQVRAFAEGGSAFARMMRIGDTIWTTVVLAVASSVPAVAAVTGWIFLLSSKVGYLNMALRKLPLTSLCAVRMSNMVNI